jgi:outer membrane protein assembly factor BamE (lipoprotein component of BamABCDE complex)
MKIAVLVLALAISGCTTVGKEIAPNQLADFKEGVTTQDEVIAKLGEPTTTTISSDRVVMVYSFLHTQARPASFIPIVGLFAGGADVRSSMVSFVFDKYGKLERYSHTGTKTGAGTGFASGRYQAPDYSLPQEAIAK